MSNKMYWYNYRSGEYEHGDVPTTDMKAMKYLPQKPAAANLYTVYRMGNLSIADAMVNVLSICAGVKPPFTPDFEESR